MFAGRTRELQQLEQVLQRGSGCLLLSGPPGIGKRTLLRQMVDIAAARGFTISSDIRDHAPNTICVAEWLPEGADVPASALVLAIGDGEIWKRQHHVTVLEPGCLKEADLVELADSDRAHELLEQSGGYPAFVSILLGAAETTLEEVVNARLSQCADPTRRVLATAAIFDRGFTFPLLQDLTEHPEDVLLDAIDDALHHDLLVQSDTGTERYQFRYLMEQQHLAGRWSASRRGRLHRKAADVLATRYPDVPTAAAEIARQYFASRSMDGAEQGIPYALSAAEYANRSFAYQEAAEHYAIAAELALTQPVSVRADIAWRLALALTQSLQLDEAERVAELAVSMLQESGTPATHLADVCWKIAHAMNASGAPAGIRSWLQYQGLRAIGDERDLAWAKLRLLDSPVELIPNSKLYVARWVGFDEEAQRIVLNSSDVEDQVQAIETFDPRTQEETRNLIHRARSWHHPFATLRALTAAGNDLMYRHGDFRGALAIWNDVLARSERVSALPWQANARNQIALLHLTLGEFTQAQEAMLLADGVNQQLGPGNDADALHMERAYAWAVYQGGNWERLAPWFLQFVDDPPHGLETQLAIPLYASMAAYATAMAGVGTQRGLGLVEDLLSIVDVPGIMQPSGVIGWMGGAVWKLQAKAYAERIDALAADLILAGVGDYPQTSLLLTRARMHALLNSSKEAVFLDQAIESLTLQGQYPLLGIALLEQSQSETTSVSRKSDIRNRANQVFAELAMSGVSGKLSVELDTSGILTRREQEVLQLVALGYSDRRIADELYVSERTVNAHVRNMLQKAEVSNRTELTRWAQEHGILAS